MGIIPLSPRRSRRSHRTLWRSLLALGCVSILSLGYAADSHAPGGGSAKAAASPAPDAFKRAHARGTLLVGVPYLAPEAKAGAKIRTPERLDGVMAERLGKALALPVKLIQIDASRQATALGNGEVDLLIADRETGSGDQPATLATATAITAGGARAVAVAAGVGTTAEAETSAEAGTNAEARANTATNSIAAAVAIPTGYLSRPKAVIRSDTKLRDWKDVKGLTVCMSTAAVQAQTLARQWGAKVHPYPVPSDALVAVREGGCDIGLVDDIAWTPLMKFPEWKKFSSTLNGQGPQTERVWIIPNDPATQAWLAKTMSEWRRDAVVPAMVTKWARDVAFDVYLDQEVPDCHG